MLGPAFGAQAFLDRRAPTPERARRGRAHQRAGVHRLGRDRLDRTAVALIARQPRHQQVDPPLDDVGHRPTGGQEPAQQPLDIGPGGFDDRGGQLLLALREVVIQRAGFDTGLVEDLVEPGRRIALAAEQGGSVLDEGGAAAIGSRHRY